MSELVLGGLSGLNPLGLLAALGAVDAYDRMRPDAGVTLGWTDDSIPRAVLSGVADLSEVVLALDADRQAWQQSVLLGWGPDGVPMDDLKPSPDDTRRWIEAVVAGGVVTEELSTRLHRLAELRLLSALVAEGAVDRSGKTKPTHLHFTAGQQRFLVMARQLCDEVGEDRFVEALAGPWRYDSDLPVFGWDVGRERVYAVRAFNPSGDKRLGVPGADWLGFLGLSYFPVWSRRSQLETTGCTGTWKSGAFTWPLWTRPARPMVIRSLLRDSSLVACSAAIRQQRGVSMVVRAPIRRTDQGGYGSFGAPEPVVRSSSGGRSMRSPRRAGVRSDTSGQLLLRG